ncbi:MAG: riboflavin synthase [Deltaproteobacteria bacterium]|nr:riboflavin synthase [Deltaproteobacteria bacterium]
MFTGIIEEIGEIAELHTGAESARMTVKAKTVLKDVRPGDSIAVSGACLTVVQFNKTSFTVDVSPETLSATILGDFRPGDRVNLERAIPAVGRFGGHLVSGHVDGIGRLTDRRPVGNAVIMTFQAPEEILRSSIPKGSIAIDGVSLTLNELKAKTFTVSIIPHTLRKTTLEKKLVGSRVNLEGDLIGKYVYRFLDLREEGSKDAGRGIDSGFLAEHGFM